MRNPSRVLAAVQGSHVALTLRMGPVRAIELDDSLLELILRAGWSNLMRPASRCKAAEHARTGLVIPSHPAAIFPESYMYFENLKKL